MGSPEKQTSGEVTKVERVQDTQSDNGHPDVDDTLDGKITWQVMFAFIALVGQANAYEMTLLVPASMLSFINADLGPDPSYTWISVSWSLCAAVVSIQQMIAASVLFGIGSGIQETFYACLMEMVPNKHRTLFIGLAAICDGPAFMSPLISYALVDRYPHLGWHGGYWFMTAWHGAAGIFLFFFYKPPTFNRKHEHDHVRKWDLIKSIDYVGLLLFTAGCVLFLVGINFSDSHRFQWTDARVLATLITGIALMISFAFWEVFASPKVPLMPPYLFRNFRGFVVIIIVCFVCGMLYYSMQVLWPQESGLLFAPTDDLIIRGCYASITAWATWAVVCSRFNHERTQIVICITVQTALIGSMASIGMLDKAQAVATVFILGCFVNQPMYLSFSILSLGLKDQNDIGIAVGIVSTFRLLGGAIATAIYSSILYSTFSDRLPSEMMKALTSSAQGTDFLRRMGASALIKAAVANKAIAYSKVPGITPGIQVIAVTAVKEAYVHAYSIVYLAAVAFGVTALVCAVFVRSIPLEKKNLARAVILENERATIETKAAEV
ncbi:TRI12-domain-containing protein [Rhizodiscina lignyota]|uniref:TRI12-domain-containing protein n=1 Tax=Rhizodiscina lignyota TaxID=1504668 RepID=A0A9P4I8A1_9PEZI|nr:TRI12-domain-containing protein [Rhizodiscina lignyota]